MESSCTNHSSTSHHFFQDRDVTGQNLTAPGNATGEELPPILLPVLLILSVCQFEKWLWVSFGKRECSIPSLSSSEYCSSIVSAVERMEGSSLCFFHCKTYSRDNYFYYMPTFSDSFPRVHTKGPSVPLSTAQKIGDRREEECNLLHGAWSCVPHCWHFYAMCEFSLLCCYFK